MDLLPLLLAAAMAAVAISSGLQLVRAGRPGHAGHPRDVDVWHGVMALAMAGMLLVTFTAGVSRGILALSALGVVWCLVQLARPRFRGVYLRLVACCAAMLAMVVPTAFATASASATSAASMGHSMAGHAGHGLPATPAGGVPTPAALPGALVAVLIVAMAAVVVVAAVGVAVRLRARRGTTGTGTPHTPTDGLRDMVMAGAMGYMLWAMA